MGDKNKKKDSHIKHPKPKPASRGLSGLAKLLALCTILVGVGFIYSDSLGSFLESWIGFSRRYKPVSIPPSSRGRPHFSADVEKRDAVVNGFKHAWNAYERDAMGADEYHPITHTGSNLTDAGGIGYFIVDSIDTMLLMGLSEEHARARDWVSKKMSFERDGHFNTFETTIRVLGGLLSAYHLSNDTIYLEKAIELGDRMLPVFETPVGLPLPMINLQQGKGVPNEDGPDLVSTAEVATLQLEFRYLSELSGDKTYWRKVENVMGVVKRARLPHSLASIYMSLREGRFVLADIRLGSRGDSYYEYLLKQYIQTNASEPIYAEMYNDAMDAIHKSLVQKSTKSQLTYTAELVPERTINGEVSWRLSPKQDHLVCFLGGSLMLGATRTGAVVRPVSIPPLAGELSEKGLRDWNTGTELVKTCMRTHDTATGLSPEIAHFRIPKDGLETMSSPPSDWYIKGALPGGPAPYDARYMLRPETVESLFLAYRLTGDHRYRDWGWSIFQAIDKHCRLESGGYATVLNVDDVPVKHDDKMETFLMSETLKYLFLLFSDSDVLPLDEYVFNTEAHPLPIFEANLPTGFV